MRPWPRTTPSPSSTTLLVLHLLLCYVGGGDGGGGRGGGTSTTFRKFRCKVLGRCPKHHWTPPSTYAASAECSSRGCFDDLERVDCHPEEGNVNWRTCQRRKCIFRKPLTHPGAPSCFYPDDRGYVLVSGPHTTSRGLSALLRMSPATAASSFTGARGFEYLTVDVEFQTRERVRLKIAPANITRFEVPLHIGAERIRPSHPLYDVRLGEGRTGFFFKLIRRSTGSTLFSTELPGLVFEDQFLQLPARLPRDTAGLYGLGENDQPSYRHDLRKWRTWVGFAREQVPEYQSNMYGVHPTYTLLESDGSAHAVLFLNSHAQEWSTAPSTFVFRSVGGLIDVYFFLGPDPDAVNRQYTEAVGRYPIPPYWSLGFHLCRFGYLKLKHMRAAKDRTLRAGIPLDSQCADIDVMKQPGRDFTISDSRFKELPRYSLELKSQGVRMIPLLDPFIYTPVLPWEREDWALRLGDRWDVWAKNADGTDATGRGWFLFNAKYPDYTDPVAKEWWARMIVYFHDRRLRFDGLTIDLNEPTSLTVFPAKCKKNPLNFPPYKTRAKGRALSDTTLCPDVRHWLGPHYSVHSLYGWSQSGPTLDGLRRATGRRGLVVSRSTFVGSGRWVAHWLGDNFSTWENLYHSVIGILQFNRFGIPQVGADICGYADRSPFSPTTLELCTRWHQLGAFYTFSRTHNQYNAMDQDPGSWPGGPGSVLARSARMAMRFRYAFLPHLYTLFYQHYTLGSSVIRALWDEFPWDPETWGVDDQFLWGSHLLVSPVVKKGARSRRAYLPPTARWYDVTRWAWDGRIAEVGGWSHDGWHLLDAPLDVIPLHLRGGRVFALQPRVGANTDQTRRHSHWTLLVAADADGAAESRLFLDDGEGIDTVGDGRFLLVEFRADPHWVSGHVLHDGLRGGPESAGWNPVLSEIDIVGLDLDRVSHVSVNNLTAASFSYGLGRLKIWGADLRIDRPFWIEYH